MNIVVTGATGYIGDCLVRHALSLNHQVITASRRPASAQIAWIPFDLTATTEIQLPAGIDAVFHLAAATTMNMDSDKEIDAARRLIKATEQVSAKFIFVSSQTASEHAPTAYGRTKWQIERLVLAAGGWVVRPGQVYGGAERGLFGVLVNAVRKLPVIPAFLPAPKVQPIHVDDVVVALLQCAESDRVPSSIFCVGATLPISFTDFLCTIARVRVQRIRLPIPAPVALIRLAWRVIGKRLLTKSGLGRLISLFDLPAMQTEGDLQRLGISLRPLTSGMTKSGNDRRRRLIREGLAFLTYVLRVRPTPALTCRYVRCIEKIRDGQPIALPEWMLRFPVTIALLEQSNICSGSAGEEFLWRLNAAVSLGEASIQGAQRFLGVIPHSPACGRGAGERVIESPQIAASIIHLSRIVATELGWRIVGWITTPMLKPLLRNRGWLQ